MGQSTDKQSVSTNKKQANYITSQSTTISLSAQATGYAGTATVDFEGLELVSFAPEVVVEQILFAPIRRYRVFPYSAYTTDGLLRVGGLVDVQSAGALGFIRVTIEYFARNSDVLEVDSAFYTQEFNITIWSRDLEQ